MENKPPDFNGMTVLALESRMAVPMQRLIEKFNGRAQLAPSLKEVPLEDNAKAFEFFQKLSDGFYDLLILMTGVGTRTLLKVLETRYSKDQILAALKKTQVVVRGPKPTAACKINQISIAVTVPPPNTWQEILQILTEEGLLKGRQVALLEYGRSDLNFLEELRTRGAQVSPIQVYQWALPDDVGPLKQAVQDILAGKIDILLQTSAVQIDHLLKMVPGPMEELDLRRALAKVAVFSIGPTTSANLKEKQIYPDFEVFPNKLEHLVEAAARRGAEVLRRKRERADRSWVRLSEPQIPSAETLRQSLADSPVMRACRLQENERVPIWLMRQAGRYMEEYQLVRRGVDFLTLCKTPELAAQVTLDAVERLGVDAAIIFSDILLIVEPMGLQLEFRESLGPLIATPLRSPEEVRRLEVPDARESLGFVFEAIRLVRRSMHPRLPLIGFCGAPFTLAAYMIEGKGSRNYIPTKRFMHEEPRAWQELMEKITAASIGYLRAQVEAGCQLLQVFDSWVGCLTPGDYREFVFPHSQRLFSSLPDGVPTIHFGTDNASLLSLQKAAGGTMIGLDWRVEVRQAWDQLGNIGVQGNLDPVVLFSPPEVICGEARKILDAVGSKPGFVFNLGHGILPETPVDHVMALVDYVHQWRL